MKSIHFVSKSMAFTALLSFVSLFMMINGCKKKEDVAIFDNTFKPVEEFSKSKILPAPDSAMLIRLMDEFASERAILDNTFKNKFPGLYKSYRYDILAQDTIRDASSWDAIEQYFESMYGNAWRAVWQDANFDRKQLSDRAAAILGSIPFTMGDLGQISGANQVLIGAAGSTPAERTVDFTSPYGIRNLYASCGLGGLDISSVNDRRANLIVSAAVVGGCSVSGEIGQEIELDRNYRYFRIEAITERANIEVFAWGAGGIFVSAGMDIKCVPVSSGTASTGVIRSLGYIWTSIPFIGYGKAREQFNNHSMTISGETAAYGNRIKVFYNPTTGGGAVAAGGGNGFSNVTPSKIKITFFN